MKHPGYTLKHLWHRYGKLLVIVVVILGAAGSVYGLTNRSDEPIQRIDRDTSSQDTEPVEPETEPAPLTGIEVKPETAQKPITGVMVENSPSARPQTGLDAADIVFEAVAEGGITRYLALYQHDIPGRVGPVRSLRQYFLDWVMGFDAPIAHVGGSPQALQLLNRRGAKDLDQFAHGGPYFRSGNRAAPHNMYVRMQDLRRLQHRKGYKKTDIRDFAWEDSEPADEPNATNITIAYSSQQYKVKFRYRSEHNDYARYLAGQPHTDQATDRQITVDNVAVIHMPTGQNGRYATMETIGNGDATIFNNGTVTEAQWRQSSYNDRIELLDESGNQIPLNRGDSWFAVLPSDKPLRY